MVAQLRSTLGFASPSGLAVSAAFAAEPFEATVAEFERSRHCGEVPGGARGADVDAIRGGRRRAVRGDDGSDSPGDAASVELEVGQLVVHRRPVEDSLVGRVGLVERAVEARRLPGTTREVPGHVVGEAVGVARLARAPRLAPERPASEPRVEEALARRGSSRPSEPAGGSAESCTTLGEAASPPATPWALRSRTLATRVTSLAVSAIFFPVLLVANPIGFGARRRLDRRCRPGSGR